MAKVTYDIYADGIQQGTINSSGNASSTTRVRSRGRFEVPALMSKIITVTATCNTGKQLSVDFMGYINSSTNSYVFDDCWFDISTSTNTYVRNYRTNPTVNYMRFVLKYADGSDITPSEITSFEVTVEDIWQADVNDNIYSLYNQALPELKAGIYGETMPFYTWVVRPGESSPVFFTENLLEHNTKFERPYPFSYWRVDDGNSGDTYKDFFMETPRIPHEPPSPGPDNPPPSPVPPPSIDPIHITVDNVKRGDAGNSYNNGKWVIPWYNIDNQTYIQVRGQDSIIPVLNSNDESQYTRYPIDNSVVFNLQRGGEN